MDSTTVIMILGSFIAAYINAVFASGGFFVLLAIATAVMPATTAVPLQPAIIYSSLIGRVGFFRKHIDRRIVLTFCLGAIFGVILGAQVFINLSEAVLSIGVGAMMLIITWVPMNGVKPRLRYPYIPVGILHAFLTTTIGASGVLQTILMRTQLRKLEITATLAACFITLEAMRLIGYASVGFDYLAHLPLIIYASIAGFLGTWVGKHSVHRVSEQMFRIIFRWLITFVGIRLMVKGILVW